MAYRFALWALSALLVLSCSSPTPTAQNPEAAQEEIAPWETVSINGVPYRRQAAKAAAMQADVIIAIAIPVSVTSNGELIFSDTVVIGDRLYTANCNTSNSPSTGGQPDVGDDVGNTRSAATPLAVNYPPVGASSSEMELTVSPPYELTAGDVDYFRIRINRDVDLAVMSLGNTDTVGSLHLSDGTLLESNDDGAGSAQDPSNKNFFLLGRVTTHTYYLRVAGTGSRPTGPYTLATGTWNIASGKPVASDYTQRAQVMIEKVEKIPFSK